MTRPTLRETIARLAPGTGLRDGLERILRGRTGALIVLGNDENVEAICDGGFALDVRYAPTRLRELAKMDGAVVLSTDGSRIVRANVHPDSHLVTDTTSRYKFAPVAKHEAVDHSKFEWTRGIVHTNTLEGFFSVLKRGLVGVYQHVDVKHLDRYLAEFDFRQNTREKLGVNDEQRADLALKGFAGKRLTYQTTNSEAEA